MYSYNRVHLVGYQTQPVDVRQISSGTSVTDLNLVVPYNFTSESGEQLQGKGFHTVTVWGGMADVAGQYVRPGSQVFIAGRLQTDSWEDEQSGEKRSKTKIVAMDMTLLDPKDGKMPAPDNAPLLTSAVNRAEIVGNVTRDPEMRTTTSGQQVLSLGIATNERWKEKASGEDKDRTEFHNVVMWGNLADQAAKSLKKGNRVYVSGRIQTRSWETPSGAKRTTTEIVADQVSMLGIESAIANTALQADAMPVDRKTSKRQSIQEDTVDSGAEKELVAAGNIPEVKYESEIKVEDLPF